ncbi:MAG: hypothetical protein BWZ02_02802 [Lentisphaerae bacterium ADurb.BinA184]|nr:MAG: hypothetical protein BWZ02_02802 [Lentisphaerae bacterium ADurb.BinA184]
MPAASLAIRHRVSWRKCRPLTATWIVGRAARPAPPTGASVRNPFCSRPSSRYEPPLPLIRMTGPSMTVAGWMISCPLRQLWKPSLMGSASLGSPAGKR